MTGSLTIQPPPGARFEYGEVKTQKGEKSLGECPILTWDDGPAMISHYGSWEPVLDSLNGTSFKVAFQAIARRMRGAGKSDDEIAQAQIDYRPGKRTAGVSTPASRAQRAAKTAAEKVDGDKLTRFLELVAGGVDIDALIAQAEANANGQ